MTLKVRHTIAAIAASFLIASAALGQSTFGSITGRITDPSGAAIPAAHILLTNQGTGATRVAVSNSSGIFDIPSLDLGTYSIHVSAQGFASYERSGLALAANQIISLNVHLTLGKTSQLIQVKAPSPIINTQGSDISNTMTLKSVEALPSIGRQAGDTGLYSLTAFAPGVAFDTPNTYFTIIGGTREATGEQATMDGISVAAYPQGAAPVSMDLDMVSEIKTEDAVAPAQFATAGNTQVVSRSGTNEFHGTLFEDYNGNALNTRNFFSPTVPFRAYNDFGASVGGPIKKNKLFFFADYEGSREAASGTLVESVPPAAWRAGDFSGLSQNVIDPATGQPFPGNMIPSDSISPVSKAIQSYAYPLPNTGVPGAVANNWIENVPSQTGFTRYNRFDGRVDYDPGSRDSLWGRFSWIRMPFHPAGIYPLYRVQTRYGQDGVLSWTHSISPEAVNSFRFGATFHRNFFTANVIGSNLLQQFGITGVPTTGVPTGPDFAIDGVTAWNPGQHSDVYYNNPDTSFEWLDDLSWTRGRHLMKVGFDAIRERFDGNSIGPTVYGEYNFTGTYTGLGYADFLLGIPQTTQLQLPTPDRALRGTTWGMYAQDDFRVTKTLTLNYGVRWELQQPYTDEHGVIYNYDPTTAGLVVPDNGLRLINAFYPKNIPIVPASQAGYAAGSLLNTDYTNIEPRIGFAYGLFGSEKTILRGGYGIYSNLIYEQLGSAMEGGPFSGSETYYNSITNGVPLLSFPSPFLPSGTTATQNVSGVNPNLTTPYTQEWNLTVERQLGSLGLRASYVGSRSVNLLYRRNLNEPAPSTTPFSTTLFPNQLFDSITYSDNGGNDSYNALELEGQRRIGRNLTFNTGFTWAKDLTDTQDDGGGGTTFGGQILQNQFCRACENSNSEVVPPRRFYAYAVYSLPFGQGHRLLPAAHGVVQALLGGWQTSWTVVLQSGMYFTPVFSGSDPSNTGVIGGVPDRVPGVPLYPANQNVGNWFNAAAFRVPGCPASNAICQNPVVSPANVGRFGNSGFNYLVGPPLRNLDFNLSKQFKIRERATLQFTLLMTDALNHPIFTEPSTNISAPATVSVISGTTAAVWGDPASRDIDFVLRLMF